MEVASRGRAKKVRPAVFPSAACLSSASSIDPSPLQLNIEGRTPNRAPENKKRMPLLTSPRKVMSPSLLDLPYKA
eukprot:5774208-Pyramimonas_sp.AAC.1